MWQQKSDGLQKSNHFILKVLKKVSVLFMGCWEGVGVVLKQFDAKTVIQVYT